MSKVWFVTGSAHGLGRHIVENALARGGRVVATARDTEALQSLVTKYEGRLLLLTLDVTDVSAAQEAMKAAMDMFDGVDVVVNNAGYGHLAAFEQMPPKSFADQINVNLMGTVNVTRAALPHMLRQHSGHIIQVSSIGGRIATPGLSAYQAAKWGVGGFSEVLSAEVRPLGVKVCVVEPGGMRTNWAQRATASKTDIWPYYLPTVGAMRDRVAEYAGVESGSPEKVAEIICRLAEHPHPPLRLMLGSDALQYNAPAEAARAATDRRWEQVSRSADVSGPEIDTFPSK